MPTGLVFILCTALFLSAHCATVCTTASASCTCTLSLRSDITQLSWHLFRMKKLILYKTGTLCHSWCITNQYMVGYGITKLKTNKKLYFWIKIRSSAVLLNLGVLNTCSSVNWLILIEAGSQIHAGSLVQAGGFYYKKYDNEVAIPPSRQSNSHWRTETIQT